MATLSGIISLANKLMPRPGSTSSSIQARFYTTQSAFKNVGQLLEASSLYDQLRITLFNLPTFRIAFGREYLWTRCFRTKRHAKNHKYFSSRSQSSTSESGFADISLSMLRTNALTNDLSTQPESIAASKWSTAWFAIEVADPPILSHSK